MKNFEELLQKELDKLPYTKHLDDGQYNDGEIAGFELGARWALSLFAVSSRSEQCNHVFQSVANQKIDLIKEYLEPTGVTITELMDRNAFASLCQLLDAYLLEAVRNSR